MKRLSCERFADRPGGGLIKKDKEAAHLAKCTYTHRTFNMTARPSLSTCERGSDEGIAKALDGCRVEPDGTCLHGLPSWLRWLGYI